MGGDGELRVDVLLQYVSGRFIQDLVSWELEVGVIDLPQHHNKDADQSPGESLDVEGRLPGEKDDEHHHEANGHPDIRA